MNYLAVKDAAASAVAQVANSDAAVASAAPDNKRVKKCKEFIASIDTIGTLTKVKVLDECVPACTDVCHSHLPLVLGDQQRVVRRRPH